MLLNINIRIVDGKFDFEREFCKFQIQFSQLQLYKSLDQSILSKQNL